MRVFFDHRWIGNHGIGRFARMLDQYLDFSHLKIGGSPVSPFDPLLMLFALIFRTPRDSVVFSPGYNAPLFKVRPYVFTIHDLNHIDCECSGEFLKKVYYYVVIRRAARSADKVLTVSEFSKSRIVEWAGVDRSRVVNVGNGVDARYHPDATPHKPGYPYLFCVGNRKAHKNEARLVEAFSKTAIDKKIKLIFSGDSNDNLSSLCAKHGVKGRVVFAGNIPEEDMPGYYRGALAVLFPSLYEGFGLPVIESMACGTPVMTSSSTSLPEVAGNAALLVNPLSVEDMANGIDSLCNNDSLREELGRKGLDNAARFSWDKVASRVSAVLDEL